MRNTLVSRVAVSMLLVCLFFVVWPGASRAQEQPDPKEEAEPPPKPPEEPSLLECERRGLWDGQKLSTSGSVVGGVAGGLFLGLIGTGIAVLAQSAPEPSAATVLSIEDEDCRYTYIQAFKSKGKGKKRMSALWGGLLGTTISLLTLFAVTG